MSKGLEWAIAGLLILPISAVVIAKLDESVTMTPLGKLVGFAIFVGVLAAVAALAIY